MQVEVTYTKTVNDANFVDMSILRCFDHLLTRTCLPDDDDNDDGLYYLKHVGGVLTMYKTVIQIYLLATSTSTIT